MSGVEGVASIFGIIQFVPEVAKTIFKAYELWEQVKDAPGNIHHLFDALKVYYDVFALIETELANDASPQNSPRGQLIRQVLHMATKAQGELFRVVEDLQQQVDAKKGFKKRVSSSRFIMKQSTIRRLEKRMQDANEALKLTLTAYNSLRPELNLERWSDVIAAKVLLKLQESATTLQCSVHDNDSKPPNSNAEDTTAVKPKKVIIPYKYSGPGRFGSIYSAGYAAWKAQVSLPKWLSNRIYELQSVPVSSGWTYNFRSYNIIDRKSVIFEKIEQGDKWGVIEMIASRKVSLFDRCESGCGLLFYAASNKQVEICEALLQMGLGNYLDDPVLGKPALESVLGSFAMRTPPEDQQIKDLFKPFVQDPNFYIPCEYPLDLVLDFMYGDERVVDFVRSWLPYYYDMPIIERAENVRLAAFVAMGGSTLHALLVPGKQIAACDVEPSTDARQSVIHSAAIALGSRLAYDFLGGRQVEFNYPKFTDDWCEFVKGVASVAQPRDLHCIETIIPPAIFQVPVWRGTPFTSLIGGALCHISSGKLLGEWDGAFHECLEYWLQELQSAGVDLLTYGQREAAILHDPSVDIKGAFDVDAIEQSRSIQRKKDVKCASHVSRRSAALWERANRADYFAIRIMDIQFGARPCDWRIMWVYEYEHLAFQFWEYIERFENARMPGTWVD